MPEHSKIKVIEVTGKTVFSIGLLMMKVEVDIEGQKRKITPENISLKNMPENQAVKLRIQYKILPQENGDNIKIISSRRI